MSHSHEPELLLLAKWIQQSTKTVVLTGAGMSTESGIPDFRSSTGLWQNLNPQRLASTQALTDHYPLFHEFYKTRILNLKDCQPHKGHYILADWERRGLLHSIATQNVDGLHQQAGNQRVYELHGSIREIRCNDCGAEAGMVKFIRGRSCDVCGGKLRPGIVLFGEMLPEDAWNQAVADIQQADLVLVIGTSLQVSPVNQLPRLTEGRVVLVNAEPTEVDSSFDLAIQGKAGELLNTIESLLMSGGEPSAE